MLRTLFGFITLKRVVIFVGVALAWLTLLSVVDGVLNWLGLFTSSYQPPLKGGW